MSNFAPFISGPPIGRGKPFGVQEIGALMNALSDASVLLDRSHGQICQANSHFFKLTAFSAREIVGSAFTDFFIYPDNNVSIGEDCTGLLKRRMRADLPVIGRFQPLDKDGHWLLATFIPEDDFRLTTARTWENKVRNIIEFSQLTDLPDSSTAMTSAVEIAKNFLDATQICVYRARSNDLTLEKWIASERGITFPKSLPYKDLSQLLQISIWRPGKRVLTDIHRFARISNFKYLASAPLGKTAPIGLFFVGDLDNDPNKLLNQWLSIVSAQISNVLSFFLLSDNLRQDISSLSTSLAIHRKVSENVDQGIIVLNPNLRLTEINSAAEFMFGYKCEEVHGQPVGSVLVGANSLSTALEAACQGIATQDPGIVILHQRNGKSFPAVLKIIPVLDERDLIAINIFITDVSERELYEQRSANLEHQAFVAEYASMFAHDVRNPINNISSGLQLIQNRLSSSDPNLNVVNRALSDCERLNRLMESFLSFSRHLDPNKFEYIDIKLLIKRILERWQSRLSRAHINLFFQAVEDLPKVYGEPRELERVFINLISNSAEVMKSTGGNLAIHISLDDSIANKKHIEIVISDDGPGIPDEIKGKIFEPFITTNPQGNGLGLAITKHILTEHHGNIRVNSFPGGTFFYVYLPAAVEGQT